MINIKAQVVAALTLLNIPVQYELFTHENITVPSISYLELTNNGRLSGDTIQYDDVNFQIKLWAKDVQYLSEKTLLINSAMEALGFTREFAQEVVFKGTISKVMRFRCITTNTI